MCKQCDSYSDLIGQRVYAVKDIDDKTGDIEVYGRGVYEGQFVPHWVDLDLILETLPDGVLATLAEKVVEILAYFSDPDAPRNISNRLLGTGYSAKGVAEALDDYFSKKEKYGNLPPEEAARLWVRDEMVASKFKSARILLDSGEYVYGTHCEFGPERKMQDTLDSLVEEFAKNGVLVRVKTVPVPETLDGLTAADLMSSDPADA